MTRMALLLVVLLAAPSSATGEIHKLALTTETGMCFVWWPVLPALDGWSHDEGASQHFSANVLVPTGQTFSDAPAVMYARATFKPRSSEDHSIAEAISNDRSETEANVPGVRVEELPPLKDGDGKKVRCFSFSPPAAGTWELVAYSEERTFWLLFCVSAKSQDALRKARPAFVRLVQSYREHLVPSPR